jgi:thymidine phosphorylase
MTHGPAHASHRLRARRLGIDTHSEAVILMRKDCPVCRSEGFSSHNRIALQAKGKQIIATLYQTESDLLSANEAGLSDAAWNGLDLAPGDTVIVTHAAPVNSLSLVRSRIYGHRLDRDGLNAIISDIVMGRYSTIEIASFLTACAALPMSREEIIALTSAMVDTGGRLSWNAPVVVDKHSVGGLPGNRTTPIIVSIVAALGLTMPKTSSRAITSPAGTADTMETMAPVTLDAAQIHDIVTREGGCIAWGGSVSLSPADDILIQIERALDLDTEGQMIASVLSKKIAAGATHLVIDIPVGPTAKVRSAEAAQSMTDGLLAVAKLFGIEARIVCGDGRQPIGRGIGPALEARDILLVLKGEDNAPRDLRARALLLSGELLELCGKAPAGEGVALATSALDDGRAWRKFQRICEAQGGMRSPPVARFQKPILASADGTITAIDNRKIARLAKLAGAPEDKAAGVDLHVRLDDRVSPGNRLCTVHAESEGELAYALAYAEENPGIFGIGAA